MAKTNAERQKLYRINLSKNKAEWTEKKEQARRRDNTRRKNLDFKSLENLRFRQKIASKKYRETRTSKSVFKDPSIYKSRQSLGKAVQRTLRSLPKDPRRRNHVLRRISQSLDIIPKPKEIHKREQRALSITLKKSVEEFYERDDISYQMPGKRDCIVVNHDGQRMVLQKRILLFSIRETYQLFLADTNQTNVNISPTSFGELRPIHVLVKSFMPHRNCLCSYHENVNLLLKSLSKHVDYSDLVSIRAFSSGLVCDENNVDCIFSRCPTCSNLFLLKIQQKIIDPNKQIQWYQWITQHGFSKKREFIGTVKECVAVLKTKVEPFLTHVFIKRQQSAYFENVKLNLDDETVCIQVDFSENFHIRVQDAVQSSFYANDAVSLFICYVWYSNGGRSFVYASDDLSHDKYYVSAALDHLFDKLRNQFIHLKQVHVFSDGATQQFKQKFLFRNLCRFSEQYQVNVQSQA